MATSKNSHFLYLPAINDSWGILTDIVYINYKCHKVWKTEMFENQAF